MCRVTFIYIRLLEEQGMSNFGPSEEAGSSHDGGEAGIKEDDPEDVKPADGTDESGCYFLRYFIFEHLFWLINTY